MEENLPLVIDSNTSRFTHKRIEVSNNPLIIDGLEKTTSDKTNSTKLSLTEKLLYSFPAFSKMSCLVLIKYSYNQRPRHASI